MAQSKHDKQLIVVAGPNGAGKTTIAREIIQDKGISYLSADDIAYEISPENPLSARIHAGKVFFSRLDDATLQGNSLLIESTLSGKSLVPKLKKYRSEYQYSISVAYIFLPNPEMCRKRIEIRVRKGGHDVPFVDIQRRFSRSIHNFWSYYRHLADHWQLIYNGEGIIQEVARQQNNDFYMFDDSLFVTFKETLSEYGQEK